MSRTTTGPWRVLQKVGHIMVVDAHRNQVMADCRLHGGNYDPSVIANLHLIAAAPDMLVALQTLVSWVDPNEKAGEGHPELHQARSAIAKARGAWTSSS